jgi:hypothetical protein
MARDYHLIWAAAYPAPSGPGPNVCPMLCTEEKLAEMQRARAGQSMQMAEVDFLGGIAHELWKEETELEAPKAALHREWDRICGVLGWGDDRETQWVTVTDYCRERYGPVCSLHQMFSAVQACRTSVQLNHNLLCNVLNVMQDGQFELLDEDAWRQTLKALRHVSDIVPVTHFRNHEFTAFGVTTLYAIALACRGNTEQVQAFVNFAMTNIPLQPSRLNTLGDMAAMSEADAVMFLRAVANAHRSR